MARTRRDKEGGLYRGLCPHCTLSSYHIDQLIPIEELSDISIRTVDTDFKSEAWKKNFLPWNQRGIDLLRYMIPCWL